MRNLGKQRYIFLANGTIYFCKHTRTSLVNELQPVQLVQQMFAMPLQFPVFVLSQKWDFHSGFSFIQIGLLLSIKVVPARVTDYNFASHISLCHWNTWVAPNLRGFSTMWLRDYTVTQRRLNKAWKPFLVFCAAKCIQMSGWELLGINPSGGSHRWRSVYPQQRLVPMGSIHFHLAPTTTTTFSSCRSSTETCCLQKKGG